MHASHERRSITLINAVEGRKRKTIHTQKYGCGVIRYTHHDQVSEAVRILGSSVGVRYKHDSDLILSSARSPTLCFRPIARFQLSGTYMHQTLQLL